MRPAAIALGASMGDRRGALELATSALAHLGPLRASRVVATPPAGGIATGTFWNAVVRVDTPLSPRELLAFTQAVEARLGRRRARRDADRRVDLDVLLVGAELVDEPGLVVPHPRMHLRRFVLEPLVDVWPDATDPRTGRAYAELLGARRHPVVAVLAPLRAGDGRTR